MEVTVNLVAWIKECAIKYVVVNVRFDWMKSESIFQKDEDKQMRVRLEQAKSVLFRQKHIETLSNHY